MVIVAEIVSLIRKPYGGYPQWALLIAGWGLFAALPVIAFVVSRIKGHEDGEPAGASLVGQADQAGRSDVPTGDRAPAE